MSDVILRVSHISKSFPGVKALEDVSFELRAGEVVSLAGENGAGKSTLLGILGGALKPDGGTVELCGKKRHDYSPQNAIAEGLLIAHQHAAVVPQLTVEQNLLLGRSATERRSAKHNVAHAFQDLKGMGFEVDPGTYMSALSPAHCHAVTIAKALAFAPRLVALDEPTTMMLEHNIKAVLARIREVVIERELGVIFVSHKMSEVMEVSDRVVVLKDGVVNLDSKISETSVDQIVLKMVGRELMAFQRQHPVPEDAPIMFQAQGLAQPDSRAKNDLTVRRGEVLGIAGLVGSGRTELLRAIVRADSGCTGQLTLEKRDLTIKNPGDARAAGIGLIPEDRKSQGLVLKMPAYKNVALADSASIKVSRFFVRPKTQISHAERIGEKLGLRPRNVRLKANHYSGGNQQKLVIGKWLSNTQKLLLFDEPTKGVDVGAKSEIYKLIDELAAAGHGIIVVSSELPEIIAVSDRVLVMRSERIVAEHCGDEINEKSLVASIMGVSESKSWSGTEN